MITIKRHRDRELDEVYQHDLLRPVLDWWVGAGAPPPLSVFSPFNLPKALLTRTALIDVEPSPRRYRIRLAGTGTCEEFNHDITGRYVEELFDTDVLGIVLAGLDRTTDTRAPDFASRRFLSERDTEFCCHRLLLPMVNPTGRVVRILSVSELCSAARSYSDVYRQARRSVMVPEATPVM